MRPGRSGSHWPPESSPEKAGPRKDGAEKKAGELAKFTGRKDDTTCADPMVYEALWFGRGDETAVVEASRFQAASCLYACIVSTVFSL